MPGFPIFVRVCFCVERRKGGLVWLPHVSLSNLLRFLVDGLKI